MKPVDYWSRKTNPETGAKFEAWKKHLDGAHDGTFDIEKFCASEYGGIMAGLADCRFRFEDDPMGEACLNYYRVHGVKKEMFETENFYTRWALFTPVEMEEEAAKGRRYPLVIQNHGGGNSIEVDEFGTNFTHMVATEKIIVMMAQNTNWQNIGRIMDILEEKYPIDTERVYITGYSQGGETTESAAMRMPKRFAAIAPCGCFVFRTFDNLNVRYTIEEAEIFHETKIPMMMVIEGNGISRYAPVNDWYGRPDWSSKAHDPEDPTNPNGYKAERNNPRPGINTHRWMLGRLNMLMMMQGLEQRDANRCISYLLTDDDELHHRVGFYGDEEEIRVLNGCKHYLVNMYNRDKINMLRYVVVDNSPHWPTGLMAELTWDFFKQFKRDKETGRLVVEEYIL